MSSERLVSIESERRLRSTAEKYYEKVRLPIFCPYTSAFINEYSGKNLGDVKTMITAYTGRVALSVSTESGQSVAQVDIELNPDAPANIVQSGYYDAFGRQDDINGKFRRLFVRTLTEHEAVGLIEDLELSMRHVPEDLM